MKWLESKAGEATNIEKRKKKKMLIPAGKGITIDKFGQIVADDEEVVQVLLSNSLQDSSAVEDVPQTSKTVSKRAPGPSKTPASSKKAAGSSKTLALSKKAPTPVISSVASESSRAFKRKRVSNDSTSEDSDGHYSLQNSDDEMETFSLLDDDKDDEFEEEPENHYAVNNYVIVLYPGNGCQYPGIITRKLKNTAVVKCMKKRKKSWAWTDDGDKCEYSFKNILRKIREPKKISKRNQYLVPELTEYVK